MFIYSKVDNVVMEDDVKDLFKDYKGFKEIKSISVLHHEDRPKDMIAYCQRFIVREEEGSGWRSARSSTVSSSLRKGLSMSIRGRMNPSWFPSFSILSSWVWLSYPLFDLNLKLMKKNYIAYLQEYEAKTSSLAKQDKYRKKFIQTVYSQDKENQNPNLPQSSSHKKKHKAKDLRESNKEGKGSSKKKSHHNSRQPTEQR